MAVCNQLMILRLEPNTWGNNLQSYLGKHLDLVGGGALAAHEAEVDQVAQSGHYRVEEETESKHQKEHLLFLLDKK